MCLRRESQRGQHERCRSDCERVLSMCTPPHWAGQSASLSQCDAAEYKLQVGVLLRFAPLSYLLKPFVLSGEELLAPGVQHI